MKSFEDAIVTPWMNAMDSFYAAVEKARVVRGETVHRTREVLLEGYGVEVADYWVEWSAQFSEDDDE